MVPAAVKGDPSVVETLIGPVKSFAVGVVVTVHELKWVVFTVSVRATGSRATFPGATRCQ